MTYPLATKAGIYELCGHEQEGRPWCKDNPRCPGYTVDLDRVESVLEAAGPLVKVALHMVPELNGTCDDPQVDPDGNANRCGGCYPCVLDQLGMAAEALRTALEGDTSE